MEKDFLAVLFPGQGSQTPGMGRDFYENSEIAREIFEIVKEATGITVASLCFQSDEEKLRETQNAQIALFTTSVATYKTWEEAQKERKQIFAPICMAGHSVGEFSALTCAGYLSIEDGARLVQKRGDLMARAGALRVGAMAAVIGLPDDAVEKVCQRISVPGREVVPANYNCPGQVVISGDRPAVVEAMDKLIELGGRCVPLNVSGAFHSPLMKEAQEAFRTALEGVHFLKPHREIPVVSNVTATPVDDPEAWKELLEQQLVSPVLWAESMRTMERMGAEIFIECGPGKVLCGLLRRTLSSAKCFSLSKYEDIQNTLNAISEVRN
ncbi:MAG TPA: ACP S-malonyltransferase [Fimbriimonadales bacterium]|nr:ACP S-malonyltransferase [Fimbriimonadales bacterium]